MVYVFVEFDKIMDAESYFQTFNFYEEAQRQEQFLYVEEVYTIFRSHLSLFHRVAQNYWLQSSNLPSSQPNF